MFRYASLFVLTLFSTYAAFAETDINGEAPVLSCETSQSVFFEDFENPRSKAARQINQEKNYTVAGGLMGTRYISNEKGSERNRAHIKLPKKLEAATLNFDVYFPVDFDFVLGGKLFGFAPDSPVWGGQNVKPNTWSSRIMWRENGTPVTYNYHQNLPGKYGEDSQAVGEPAVIPRGQWVSLSLYVDLGQAANSGTSEVWMNGRKVSSIENLDFHAPDKTAPITTLALQTFFGGSSPKWAPKNADGSYRNLSALVDNMGVTEGRCIREKAIATF